MAAEHAPVRAPVIEGPAPSTAWPDLDAPHVATADPETASTPPSESLVEIAAAMPAGKALDLGCGEGQDSVWLARQGWIVNAVDASPGAISAARAAAAAANVAGSIVFTESELADWRPVSRYDLVFCTFSLPARGSGRSRMLEHAVAAVAPGGTILLTDLDGSLAREGWMADRYLTSTEELERHLGGFRVERSAVRLARLPHGYEERVLPVALVVATRRTDLRTL